MPQVRHTPNFTHTVVEQKLERVLGRKFINEVSLEIYSLDGRTKEENNQLTLAKERDLG